MHTGPELVLASASPRRRELLARVGLRFRVAVADADETPLAGELPPALATRLAGVKAELVKARHPTAWVLAADTVVALDDEVLGKADDEADAARMLSRLSGRTHRVITGWVLLGPDGGATQMAVTEVDFRALSSDEIAGYVETGEWRNKAGAYAVQGIAASFVSAIRGSYTNVVGLPLAEVVIELAARGAPTPRLADGEPA